MHPFPPSWCKAMGRYWPPGSKETRGALPWRVKTDGSLDTSFGGGGKVFVVPTGFLALQRDGRIVTLGNKSVGKETADGRSVYRDVIYPAVMARYNDDGTPDTTFHRSSGDLV